MSLVQLNWRPDRKTLAEFSEAWMFFIGMLAAPLALYKGHETLAVVLWGVALAGRAVGFVRPQWMQPLFVAMSVAAWPIGWTVSHLAMALVFYGVFTPVGLFFRLIGRDPLKRKLEPQATTYWEAYRPDRDRARYLKQF